MVQTLTVCRSDPDWIVRDVTGEAYGRSPDIRNVYDAAQQMARRIGAHIEFSREAEAHYRAVMAGQSVGTLAKDDPKSTGRFRALIARLAGRLGGHEADR